MSEPYSRLGPGIFAPLPQFLTAPTLRRSEREVSARKSPVAELAKFRTAEMGELFREELDRARHFEPLLARIQAYADQRTFDQLGVVATVDEFLWQAAVRQPGSGLPIGTAGLGARRAEIRENGGPCAWIRSAGTGRRGGPREFWAA